MSTSNLITAADLAARWNVTQKTIRERANEHGMPVYRIGRAMRFDLAECETWLREHSSTAPADGGYRAAVRRLVDQAPELSAEQADRISSRDIVKICG